VIKSKLWELRIEEVGHMCMPVHLVRPCYTGMCWHDQNHHHRPVLLVQGKHVTFVLGTPSQSRGLQSSKLTSRSICSICLCFNALCTFFIFFDKMHCVLSDANGAFPYANPQASRRRRASAIAAPGSILALGMPLGKVHLTSPLSRTK